MKYAFFETAPGAQKNQNNGYRNYQIVDELTAKAHLLKLHIHTILRAATWLNASGFER